jgi:hypothetical protein
MFLYVQLGLQNRYDPLARVIGREREKRGREREREREREERES